MCEDQAWFWTDQWQEMERQAQDDIDNNRIMTFDDVDDAIAYLTILGEEDATR